MSTNTNFEKAENAINRAFPSPSPHDQSKIGHAHALSTLALAEVTQELVTEQKRSNDLAETANLLALLNSDGKASQEMLSDPDTKNQLIDILAERMGLPKPDRTTRF